MTHINSIVSDFLDPLEFAYRPNRSVDDAISLTLHTALEHQDRRDTYIRLFIDFSSAFNIIVPFKLILKLRDLGLGTPICNWILDFLTGRHRVLTIGSNTSSILVLNTGAPQGCCLSPWLYYLFIDDCSAVHGSNRIINSQTTPQLCSVQKQSTERR